MSLNGKKPAGSFPGFVFRVLPVCLAVVLLNAGMGQSLQAQTQTQTQPQAVAGSDALISMRQSIELFSTTLKEGLGLNERRGIFSPRAGDVRGRYLQGQGIVLEVMTPLQTRDGIGMDSFGSSLTQLSSQLDDLLQQGASARPDFEAMRDQLALSMRSDEAAAFYRDLMQQLSSVQDLPAIERSLAAAANSLQSLQSAAQIEPETRQRWIEELQTRREQLRQQMEEWDQFRSQIRDQAQRSELVPDAGTQQAWAQTRARLEQQMSSLRSSISEHSRQMEAQRVQAEQQRRQQASLALEQFQSRLFTLLCDYAAGLRSLPANEALSIVLLAVGDELASGTRRDLVYQVSRDSLQACQQGQISAAQLQQRSTSYQY